MKAVMARTLGRGGWESFSWAIAEEKARSETKRAAAKRIKNGSVFIGSRPSFTSLLALEECLHDAKKCGLSIFRLPEVLHKERGKGAPFCFRPSPRHSSIQFPVSLSPRLHECVAAKVPEPFQVVPNAT